MTISFKAALVLTLALVAAAPMAHAADAAVGTKATVDHKGGVVHHVKKASHKTVKAVNKAPAKSKADVNADGTTKAE